MAMQKRFAMVVDTRRCIGCHACTVACKAENNVPLGGWRTQVRYLEKGKYPYVKKYFLPILCDHCENPPCVKASKKEGGAAFIKRDDGIITIDKSKCKKDKFGVYEGAAVESCPLGQIYTNKQTGLPDKCSLCAHRVDKGLVPACVQTCLGRARVFGDINDPESEASILLVRNGARALRPEEDHDPGVYYLGLDMHQTHGSQKIKGFKEFDPQSFDSGVQSQQ